MAREFGLVPVSLALDFSGYEDDWKHVAAFRGQAGWLLMASATIQSAHDLLHADLVVACDDQDNAIPSWRAVHLTQCPWSALDHCDDEPPTILDDLLCEEEGALYARWQREANTALAQLHDRAQRDIETLEGQTSRKIRQIERHMNDLRRRKRMTDDEDARRVLSTIIADLEEESDDVLQRLVARRDTLRRSADAAEESLWQRTDVLIEVDPVRLVRWRDGYPKAERALYPVWKSGRFYAPKMATEYVEPEAAEAVLEKVAAALKANAKRQAKEETVNDIPAWTRAEDLPKSAPIRQQLTKDDLMAEAMRAWAEQTRPASPIAPMQTQQLPLPEIGVDLIAERAALAARLEALEISGQKFFPRSRKFERNQTEREAVSRQIASLDLRLAKNDGIDDHWSPERVARLRELWLGGCTARQIANDLGGTSRNAVIGKAKRIGIYFRSVSDTRQANENSVSADL